MVYKTETKTFSRQFRPRQIAMDLNEFPLQNRKLQIGKIAFTKISNYGRILIMKCTGSRINGILGPHPRDQNAEA